ncbi:hypothetical protein KUV22_17175 [Microbulbifer agarilyticus]|uniref:hypothetical protein n=1 Tax=Microbulbifer agarilyticus TaxID=260552 RepID=UPI001C96A6D7|nr:hypothetical protein [Microbulbifer agarilyticus]MBY6192154.1 hypothetical protein [Microbulbifer agarilyticus]
MKKFCVFAFLAFYCSTSLAQSLRGVSGHEQCEKLESIENTLGSELLDKGERHYVFNGVHFGRPVEVRYLCSGNSILVQFISFQNLSKLEAKDVYLETMQTLATGYYGAPGREEFNADNEWERVAAWSVEDGTALLLLQMKDSGPNVSINRIWNRNSNKHRQ